MRVRDRESVLAYSIDQNKMHNVSPKRGYGEVSDLMLLLTGDLWRACNHNNTSKHEDCTELWKEKTGVAVHPTLKCVIQIRFQL